ncbi:MAG: HEAT repeat domain-containing protein [Nocardioidaceae bacterium]
MSGHGHRTGQLGCAPWKANGTGSKKRQLGWDESTPPALRGELLRDPDPRVRAAAAQHASPEQLRALATDPRAEVRLAVGANANTPSDVRRDRHQPRNSSPLHRHPGFAAFRARPPAALTGARRPQDRGLACATSTTVSLRRPAIATGITGRG